MSGQQMSRGAWRRNPVLPRAMTQAVPRLAGSPSWAEPEGGSKRLSGALGGAIESHLPKAVVAESPTITPEDRIIPVGFDITPGNEAGPAPLHRVRTGGCLCGAVRYEVHGEPKLVGLCHCADCRKSTGGYALHYADWPVSAVRLTGQLSTYAGRSFCSDCGSRVVHFSAHHTEVLLGTLDDPPNDLVPQVEIWTIRREPWLPPVPGARQFERDPS
jgi:hypothetical protein